MDKLRKRRHAAQLHWARVQDVVLHGGVKIHLIIFRMNKANYTNISFILRKYFVAVIP